VSIEQSVRVLLEEEDETNREIPFSGRGSYGSPPLFLPSPLPFFSFFHSRRGGGQTYRTCPYLTSPHLTLAHFAFFIIAVSLPPPHVSEGFIIFSFSLWPLFLFLFFFPFFRFFPRVCCFFFLGLNQTTGKIEDKGEIEK